MHSAAAQLSPSKRSEKDSAPIWLWPNVLGLDAPIVAVAWQGLLADRFSLPLHLPSRLALGLTVWAIYILDRLLDARTPPVPDEPARHRYCRRHWWPMAALLALVVAADAWIVFERLRPAILHEGLIPLAGVLVYLGLFHVLGPGVRVPKEIAAAVLFTAGTFLTAWTRIPSARLLWPAAAFFALCLANIVAIETWEWRELPNKSTTPHSLTRWLARIYLFWVSATVILCLGAGRNEWYLSIALGAAGCELLYVMRRRLSLEARRALVDGVLLAPLLFLLHR